MKKNKVILDVDDYNCMRDIVESVKEEEPILLYWDNITYRVYKSSKIIRDLIEENKKLNKRIMELRNELHSDKTKKKGLWNKFI